VVQCIFLILFHIFSQVLCRSLCNFHRSVLGFPSIGFHLAISDCNGCLIVNNWCWFFIHWYRMLVWIVYNGCYPQSWFWIAIAFFPIFSKPYNVKKIGCWKIHAGSFLSKNREGKKTLKHINIPQLNTPLLYVISKHMKVWPPPRKSPFFSLASKKYPPKKLQIKNFKNLFQINCIFIYMGIFDSFHFDLLCKTYEQSYFLGN